MMWKPTETFEKTGRRLIIVVLFLLFAYFASPASAQDYSFTVENMQMQVFVRQDGLVRIVYDIKFRNSDFGRDIDIVDIGTPDDGYNLSNMLASVDGVVVTDIRPSEFVKPGVEIHLGTETIRPGRTATLHFDFIMPELIFQDVTNRDLASLQITPTWFDSKFLQGTTNLQIAIHMLEGIDPEEVLFQDEPFTNKAIFQNHTVVVWEFPNTQLTGPHLVGVSFPQRGLTQVVRMNVFTMAFRWFENNQDARVIAGLIFIGLFSFMYLRFTGGTGITIWVLLVGGLIFMFIASLAAHLIGFIPLIGLLILSERHLQKRKKTYLPPIAQVEGGGIKRGLTAPEAAALLEMPINKVLTLIIFGLLKKGILLQLRDTPLEVEVVEEFRAKSLTSARERQKHRRKAAQAKGIVIHSYEDRFLDVIEARPGKAIHKIDFSQPMKWFLRNVAKRIKGFDLSDTKTYYERIVQRAWKQAKEIGEIPEREKYLDRNMEWVLMHDDYPTVFHTPRYTYFPIWVRPMVLPSGRSASASGGGRSSSTSSAPQFSDVAAGFAGWTENTMGRMASAIMPGSLQIEGPKGGVINLSGLDKATGDFFEALAKSSGSGGGGGGGCACACAGCACACACAGGGR